MDPRCSGPKIFGKEPAPGVRAFRRIIPAVLSWFGLRDCSAPVRNVLASERGPSISTNTPNMYVVSNARVKVGLYLRLQTREGQRSSANGQGRPYETHTLPRERRPEDRQCERRQVRRVAVNAYSRLHKVLIAARAAGTGHPKVLRGTRGENHGFRWYQQDAAVRIG